MGAQALRRSWVRQALRRSWVRQALRRAWVRQALRRAWVRQLAARRNNHFLVDFVIKKHITTNGINISIKYQKLL